MKIAIERASNGWILTRGEVRMSILGDSVQDGREILVSHDAAVLARQVQEIAAAVEEGDKSSEKKPDSDLARPA